MVLTFLPDFERYASTLQNKASKSEEETLTSKHLDFFLKYIRDEHRSTLSTLQALLAHGEITFDLLWAILVPRSIILTKCKITGEPRALRIVDRNKRSGWSIEAEYVESDVHFQAKSASREKPKFCFVTDQSLFIPHFKGTVKITSLAHYPIRFHPRTNEIMASLVMRGMKRAALQGVHHMHYKGTANSVHGETYIVSLSTNQAT